MEYNGCRELLSISFIIYPCRQTFDYGDGRKVLFYSLSPQTFIPSVSMPPYKMKAVWHLITLYFKLIINKIVCVIFLSLHWTYFHTHSITPLSLNLDWKTLRMMSVFKDRNIWEKTGLTKRQGAWGSRSILTRPSQWKWETKAQQKQRYEVRSWKKRRASSILAVTSITTISERRSLPELVSQHKLKKCLEMTRYQQRDRDNGGGWATPWGGRTWSEAPCAPVVTKMIN